MKVRQVIVIAALLAAAHPVAARQRAPARADWSSVEALPAGTKITLTVDDGPPAARRFVSADLEAVVVLILPNAGIPPKTEDALIDLAVHHPERLARVWMGVDGSAGDLRIGLSGVYDHGRRIADVDRVLVRVMRDRVVELRAPGRRNVTGAVIGTLIGAGAGLAADAWLLDHCSCDTRSVAIPATLIALPAAGAAGGFFAFGRKTPELVYHR